jgi:mitochondrial fission protein ELM1
MASAFALHILNPRLPPRLFDLIAAPAHDNLRAPNVIATAGSVHRVTAARLAEATEQFRAKGATLPKPHVAVLLGGASRAFRFSPTMPPSSAPSSRSLRARAVGPC